MKHSVIEQTSINSRGSDAEKLGRLLDVEGYSDSEELVHASLFGSNCYGICLNQDCDYTTDVEPDQRNGWCEACGTPSVMSGLELAL